MSRKVTIKGKLFIEHFDVAAMVIARHPGLVQEGCFFKLTNDEYLSRQDTGAMLKDIESTYGELVVEKLRRQAEERLRLEAERRRLEEERLLLEEQKRVAVNQQTILRQLIELERKQIQAERDSDALDKTIALQRAESIAAEREKARIRDEREERIIANAKKHGYEVKKRINEEGKVKLILQRRVY